MKMGIFAGFRETVTNMLVPRKCPLCGKIVSPNEQICGACSDTLVTVDIPVCRVCGREFYDCICDDEGFWFDRCVSPFVYSRAARNGVRRLKYNGDTSAAAYFARRMAVSVRQEFARYNIDFVTCVPTHSSDWSERGYNHAALIARALASELEMKYSSSVLQKTRKNSKQHTLNRQERLENVRGVYRVSRPDSVAGRTILLVDDVSTTGCTLNECARVLKQSGAKTVLCACATVVQHSYMSAPKQAILGR